VSLKPAKGLDEILPKKNIKNMADTGANAHQEGKYTR
jgi:hypothetical protein